MKTQPLIETSPGMVALSTDGYAGLPAVAIANMSKSVEAEPARAGRIAMKGASASNSHTNQ